MRGRKGDFSYTSGIIARKLGVSINTVKNYLKKSGLEKQCYRDENNHLRIPAHVAIKFVPAESLAIQLKHNKKNKRKKIDDNPDADFQELFSELGITAHQQDTPNRRPPKALTDLQRKKAELVELFESVGISDRDVLNFIKAQQEGEREKNKEDAGS